MRIISGEAGGRTLFAPSGDQTRPTSDKIRGSLFNILGMKVHGAQVADLFGGTGALSLEALSRGASRAVIVESNRQAFEVICRNAQNVLKDDTDVRVKLMKADYRSAVSRLAGYRFDLVFLDPPYRMTEAYADAINRLNAISALHEDTLIIAERRHDARVAYPEEYEIYDTRNYGETSIDFIRRRRKA